jgi:hypothetical protein
MMNGKEEKEELIKIFVTSIKTASGPQGSTPRRAEKKKK